jgi:hypothetical protein
MHCIENLRNNGRLSGLSQAAYLGGFQLDCKGRPGREMIRQARCNFRWQMHHRTIKIRDCGQYSPYTQAILSKNFDNRGYHRFIGINFPTGLQSSRRADMVSKVENVTKNKRRDCRFDWRSYVESIAELMKNRVGIGMETVWQSCNALVTGLSQFAASAPAIVLKPFFSYSLNLCIYEIFYFFPAERDWQKIVPFGKKIDKNKRSRLTMVRNPIHPAPSAAPLGERVVLSNPDCLKYWIVSRL